MKKKEYILGKGGGEALRGGALGPEAAVEILVLFLFPRGRPRRRSRVLGLVLTAAKAAATSLLRRRTEVQL
jgi:hypothetical protein